MNNMNKLIAIILTAAMLAGDNCSAYALARGGSDTLRPVASGININAEQHPETAVNQPREQKGGHAPNRETVKNIPFFNKTAKGMTTIYSLLVGAIFLHQFPVWLHYFLISSHPAFFTVLTILFLLNFIDMSVKVTAVFTNKRPVAMAPPPGLRVAMVVPCVPSKEPFEMLEKTIRALACVEYAHDTWVLDEDNDPRLKMLCDSLGVNFFSRKGIEKYNQPKHPFLARSKAGNLNSWLCETGFDKYDYVTFIDSDHVAEPYFLDKVLGYFNDPEVQFTQAPQTYYNQEESIIARGMDAHSYHYYYLFHPFFYTIGATIVDGSHTTFRTSALKKLGYYPNHPGEDFLCGIMMAEQRMKGVYIPEIIAQGTTPANWSAFIKQQQRWAFSSLSIKFHYFLRNFKKLRPLHRILFLYHGAYYIRHVPFLMLLIWSAFYIINGTVPAYLSGGYNYFDAPIPGGWGILFWGLIFETAHNIFNTLLQKFFPIKKKYSGFNWRGGILEIGLWPFFCKAFFNSIFKPTGEWVITSKKKASRAEFGLFKWHIAAIVLGSGVLVKAIMLMPYANTLGAIVGLFVLLNIAVLIVAALPGLYSKKDTVSFHSFITPPKESLLKASPVSEEIYREISEMTIPYASRETEVNSLAGIMPVSECVVDIGDAHKASGVIGQAA